MMQTTPKHQPTAQHKRYHAALRELGCVIAGEKVDIQLHHCGGASCRHNKIWIGQWWVLVLRRDFHDNRAGQIYNVTDHKKTFELTYGTEKEVFMRQHLMLVGAMALGASKLSFEDLPPQEVMNAILEFRR